MTSEILGFVYKTSIVEELWRRAEVIVAEWEKEPFNFYLDSRVQIKIEWFFLPLSNNNFSTTPKFFNYRSLVYKSKNFRCHNFSLFPFFSCSYRIACMKDLGPSSSNLSFHFEGGFFSLFVLLRCAISRRIPDIQVLLGVGHTRAQVH